MIRNHAVVLVIIFSTLLAGCGGPNIIKYNPWGTLPRQDRLYSADNQRLDPLVRIERFEDLFMLDGHGMEPGWQFGSYSDIKAMIYPATRRIEAAWQLVFLGNDFMSVGNPSGAARSYWAALSLGSQMLASKRDIEALKSAAYFGLSNSALRKGQKSWAEIMYLCSSLSAIYVGSSDGESEDQSFYKNIKDMKEMHQKQLRMEAEARAAASRAETAAFLGALANGVNAVGTGMQYGSNSSQYQQALNSMQTNMMNNFKSIDDGEAEANKALSSYKSISDRFTHNFNRQITEDIAAVESTNQNLASHILRIMTLSSDKSSIVNELKKFAYDKPDIQKSLSHYEKSFAEKDLVQLLDKLSGYEISIIKRERMKKKTG